MEKKNELLVEELNKRLEKPNELQMPTYVTSNPWFSIKI